MTVDGNGGFGIRVKGYLLGSAVLLTFATSAFAAPASTSTSIGLAPNPVEPGADYTATGTTTSAGSPVGQGHISIHQLNFACKELKNQTSFPGLGATVAEGDVDPSTGKFSASLQAPPTEGSYGHHAKYTQGTPTYKESTSPCLDLQVASGAVECPANGLTILATNTSGNGCPAPGESGPWCYTMTVTNCTDDTIHGVTAQGGNNGWTGNVYTSNPDTGTVNNRKVNNKNTVLLWTIGDLEAHDEANLEICFNQPVKKAPDGTILFLNGPWSAINGDTGVKTDYTDRMVLITEQTGTCPEL